MRLRDVLAGFILGTAFSLVMTWFGMIQIPDPAVYAQAQSVPMQTAPADSRFTLAAGAYGEDSFYAVKVDQQTGQTWVLTGKKGATDDEWIILPEKDKRR
jgi:hypothetical protein